MTRRKQPALDDDILSALPEAAKLLALGDLKTIEAEYGEWLIEIGKPPKEIDRFLPIGSVVLASNEYGDFLFLQPTPDDGRKLSPVTYVYWHEGPQIEVFSPDIQLLAQPSDKPSETQPFYADGTPVLLGDRVELRVWIRLFRMLPGTVIYVPGISKRRTQMEHGGLTWVGIRLADSGTVLGSIVDPETKRLKRGVRLLGRGEPRELSERAGQEDGIGGKRSSSE